ncbi:mucin-2-like isoform X2 [Rhopalosiphum padi]|uniref:mucin-2-like isoform X2 n=1 Tax=Rhopalosiphum padi TaxID=40932 RepID=UPI00298DC0A3|nr:mucin-2-like isoform X2 [Rhopalosiphum padi]
MHKQDSTSALFRGLYVSLTPFEQCLAYCVTNNSNIVDKRSTAINSLQQAAELLDRCQKLLQAANAEAASHATTETAARATTETAARATTETAARATTEAAARAATEAAARATTEAAAHATTAARVRRMPTAELRRDPVLWVAYTRGWDDHALVYSKSTNVGPIIAVTGRSQSPRRPVQPARTPRPPPMPQSTPLLRPPPQPLMAVLVPRPKSFKLPAPPATRKVDQKSAQITTPAEQTTTAPPQNSRQRWNQSRMREYRGQKKAANPTTSQQYRLEKPAPLTTQPAPDPMSLEATNTPVPEAKTPEVAMPVDMKTSPDEEKELLCDMMDVGPPDDVDTVLQITSPDPTTPPRHG